MVIFIHISTQLHADTLTFTHSTQNDRYMERERERQISTKRLYGRGYAKNGNTAENPYNHRNKSNLVEEEKKNYVRMRIWIAKERGNAFASV